VDGGGAAAVVTSGARRDGQESGTRPVGGAVAGLLSVPKYEKQDEVWLATARHTMHKPGNGAP